MILRPPRSTLFPYTRSSDLCGLEGTIANTVIALLDRGYVPDNRRLRRTLEIPEDERATIHWEQYDTTPIIRSEEHTSELQSQSNLVCRLLLEKKKKHHNYTI